MCKLKYKTWAAIVKVNTFIITGLSTSLYINMLIFVKSLEY